MMQSVPVWAILAVGIVVGVGACGDEDAGESAHWQVVHRELPGALLSVWGTSASDVWAVGSDTGDGQGPTVLHYDGAAWSRVLTGHTGDLWWVFGFRNGPVYMAGAGGTILRWQGGAFERMQTPGTDTVFGVWGASRTELWAVGGATGGARGAFAWRLDGDAWVPAAGFPAALAGTDAIWKVHGRSADDVWLVGTRGTVVHWDGAAFTAGTAAAGESLFTVHASSRTFVTVGGFGTGVLLENDGDGWVDASPRGAAPLVGVCLTDEGGTAVGQYGAVFAQGGDGWHEQDTGLVLDETLHSVWIDDAGGVWAVGGQVSAFPLIRGVMLHRGEAVVEGGL